MATQCPKCNAENPDTKQFCGDCGTQLPTSVGISSSHTKTLLTPAKDSIEGTTFAGRYQLVEELGRGGMGVVYKAEDTKLKRTVALKFLPLELTHIPEVKDRFMREAQAAASLDHPNICTVHEFDEAEGKTYISMAFIEGQNLREKTKSGPLEMNEALKIATQVADGLQTAHDKGIVHRDVKSANIMVTDTGQARIMDFGLARMTGGTLLTQEGKAMGTIAYMSPEQAQGEKVDHRTDIWSFGVVLYEMLTGELPFKGEHEQAVVYSIRKDKPKPFTDLKVDIPVSIEQVVSKALEKNPDERYQQIDKLLDDLKSISAGIVPEEIKARLRKAKLRRRKKAILYTFVAGLAIAMVVIALSLFRGRADAIESIAVLPLENLTGDMEKQYVVDSVTDALIGQLGQISGLKRVTSRTTVMQYKEAEKSLSDIARELKVDAIVEGTVYQAGESIQVRFQLTDALPEEQNLWSETYERPMRDVLMMYSEVAQEIARKIKIGLTQQEETRFANARQVNPEAYEAYIQGRLHWYMLTPQDIETALQHFESALEIDPNFALAHTGVALVWAARGAFGFAPFQEAYPKAKAAAEKAMELDDTLAETYYVMAQLKGGIESDWEGAETAYLKAIELNPNYPDANAYYSHLLSFIGRIDEALPHIERALEIDPFNALFHGMYAIVLQYHRRFDESIAAARTGLALQPGHPLAQGALQYAFIAKGMHDEQLAIQRGRIALDPERLAAFERGLEEGGYRGAQRGIADVLAARYGKPGKWVFNAHGIFLRYLDAGENELALDWLEKAFEEHDAAMHYLGLPLYDPLRSYPRFQELLRKMNLPVDEKE